MVLKYSRNLVIAICLALQVLATQHIPCACLAAEGLDSSTGQTFIMPGGDAEDTSKHCLACGVKAKTQQGCRSDRRECQVKLLAITQKISFFEDDNSSLFSTIALHGKVLSSPDVLELQVSLE